MKPGVPQRVERASGAVQIFMQSFVSFILSRDFRLVGKRVVIGLMIDEFLKLKCGRD